MANELLLSPEEILEDERLIRSLPGTLRGDGIVTLLIKEPFVERIVRNASGPVTIETTTNGETMPSTFTKDGIPLLIAIPCKSPPPTPASTSQPVSIATTVSTPSSRHIFGVITSSATSSLPPSNKPLIQLNPPVMFHFNIQEYAFTSDCSDAIINQALHDYQSGDYLTAEGRCILLLRQQPQNSKLLLLLSAIYFKSGKLDKSEHFSKLAIHSNPAMAEGYSNLANCLRSKGLIQQAIENYRHAIRLKPDFIDGFLNLGYVLEEAGELEQAKDAYSMAIQLNPDLYQVRNDLGKVLRSLGKLEDARKFFIESIETRVDFSIAWANLGCVYSDQGELWLAIHHLERATSLDPTFVNAHVNLGNVFKGGKVLDKALNCYRRALQLNPMMTEVQENVNEIERFLEKRKADLAKNPFKSFQDVNPDSPEMRCFLVERWISKGELANAEKEITEAMKKFPNDKLLSRKLEKVREHLLVSVD